MMNKGIKKTMDIEIYKKVNELAYIVHKKRDLSESGSEEKKKYRKISKQLDRIETILKRG